MSTSLRFRLILALVVLTVGVIDAALSREWDLLGVFLLAAVVLSSLLVNQRQHRATLSVRADLARWLRQRADSTGEPIDDVVDRTIASVKHGLFADDDDGLYRDDR